MKSTLPIHRFSFFAILFAVFVLIVSPFTSAKASGSGIPTDPFITNAGCMVTVSFTAPLATTYHLELFDDLTLIYASPTVTTAIGQVVTFSFIFPSIERGIPGIGIYLYEGSTQIYSADPYIAIENTCNPCADGLYQGVTTAWTKLYWGTSDDKGVVPDTFIEPNKRVVLVDNPIPGWYRIALSCKFYYVKVGTMTTNFEKSAKPFLNGR